MSEKKTIDERVERSDVHSIDFHGRRITNASPSVNDFDYVVRKELQYLRTQLSPPAAAVSLATAGTLTYTPDVAEYGRLKLKDIVVNGSATAIHLAAACIEETIVDKLYGVLQADLSTTNPVTITPTINAETGYSFADYQYLAFDDPAQDAGNTDFRSYEICSFTINGSDYTLTRGQLGSAASAHLAGTKFYPVRVVYQCQPFKAISPFTGFPKIKTFELPNLCVLATVVALDNLGGIGASTTVNCSKLAYPFPSENPAPGFRTLNGAEYLGQLIGVLAIGQSLPCRIVTSENAVSRNLVGSMTIAPVGNNTVFNGVLGSMTGVADVFYVLFIEPLRNSQTQSSRRVAILDQLAIRENEFWTFLNSSVPNFRRMPYLPIWPPNVMPVIGTVDSIYDSSTGAVRVNALPFSDSGQRIIFEENGELDVVVAKIGTSNAGANFTLASQT